MNPRSIDTFLPPRKKIGILTGSGPDAGLDLWAKILRINKQVLGESFRGDLDAPAVTIISEPSLGLSMELEQFQEPVWQSLQAAAIALSRLVDCYAIACNTLNSLQERLEKLQLPARLVSFANVVTDYIGREKLDRLCLLGARPVMELGPWSAYRGLQEIVKVEVPAEFEALHQLIYDIKTFGGDHPGIRDRFQDLLAAIESRTVLLACTELPLVEGLETDHQLVDVTELVAAELVRLSFDPKRPDRV